MKLVDKCSILRGGRNINSERVVDFYKMYPDKLIEGLYPDIKLYHYQRLLLRLMIRNKSGRFAGVQNTKNSKEDILK